MGVGVDGAGTAGGADSDGGVAGGVDGRTGEDVGVEDGRYLSETLANSLGLSEVEPIETVGSVGGSVGSESKLPRREWRIVSRTGELRGVCWRERNPERKAIRYVGKRNRPEEFKIYADAYAGWRRANRSFACVGVISTADAAGPQRGANGDG